MTTLEGIDAIRKKLGVTSSQVVLAMKAKHQIQGWDIVLDGDTYFAKREEGEENVENGDEEVRSASVAVDAAEAPSSEPEASGEEEGDDVREGLRAAGQEDEKGNLVVISRDDELVSVALGSGEFATSPTFVSHFATCPESTSHRKSEEREAHELDVLPGRLQKALIEAGVETLERAVMLIEGKTREAAIRTLSELDGVGKLTAKKSLKIFGEQGWVPVEQEVDENEPFPVTDLPGTEAPSNDSEPPVGEAAFADVAHWWEFSSSTRNGEWRFRRVPRDYQPVGSDGWKTPYNAVWVTAPKEEWVGSGTFFTDSAVVFDVEAKPEPVDSVSQDAPSRDSESPPQGSEADTASPALSPPAQEDAVVGSNDESGTEGVEDHPDAGGTLKTGSNPAPDTSQSSGLNGGVTCHEPSEASNSGETASVTAGETAPFLEPALDSGAPALNRAVVPIDERVHPMLAECRLFGRERARTSGWYGLRSRGIGSSDMSGILGVNPHAKPIDVWRSKVGEPERARPWLEEYAEFGSWFESHLLRAICMDTGRDLIPGDELGTLQSAANPIFLANIDSLDPIDGANGEIKTSESEWDYVPEEYYAQTQEQMFVTGADFTRLYQYIAPMSRKLIPGLVEAVRSLRSWPFEGEAEDVVANWLLAQGKIVTWRIDRNDAYIEEMVARGEAFWKYVLDVTEPPDVEPIGQVDLTSDAELYTATDAIARAAAAAAPYKSLFDAIKSSKEVAKKELARAVSLLPEPPKKVKIGEHSATFIVTKTHSYWRFYPRGDSGIEI